MGIMLGNQSIEQIEKRLGIEIPKDLKDYMSENRQHEAAKVKDGKWHCFDIPFMIVCGGEETAILFRDSLSPLSGDMTGQLQIGIQ